MEASSSSNSGAIAGEVDLEDLWSDLHTLKKLYGLLQRRNATVPQGESQDGLDERARLLLKKLLDGATQQALQSQAKIVSCKPETPRAEEPKLSPPHEEPKRCPPCEDNRKDNRGPTGLNQGRAVEKSSSPARLPPSQEADLPGIRSGAEPEVKKTPCPRCAGGDPKLLKTEKSMRQNPDTRDQKPERRLPLGDHHRQILQDRANTTLNRSSKISIGDLESRRKQRSPGPGVTQLRGRTLSRARIHDRAHGESTLVKKSPSPKEVRVKDPVGPHKAADGGRLRGAGSKDEAHAPRGLVNRKDGGSKRAGLPPQTAANRQEKKLERCHALERTQMRRQSSGYRVAIPEKHPTRVGTIPRTSNRASRRVEGGQKKANVVDQVDPRGRKLSRRIPSRIRPKKKYSSTSETTRSDSSTSSLSTGSSTRSDSVSSQSWRAERRRRSLLGPTRHPLGPANDESMPRRRTSHYALSPSRAVPTRERTQTCRATQRPQLSEERHPQRRMLNHRKEMGPPTHKHAGTTKADHGKKPGNREGRLKRIKDKLAIIFHHHHHHHHHHHGGDSNGQGGAYEEAHHNHGSRWKYVRRVLHHTNEGEHGKLVAGVHGERAATSHGHVHELLAALLRHLWGSNTRKAARPERGRLGKTASRVGAKKLHWWQRFRRSGGVKLANHKKPRLKLGFAGSRRRACRKD